MKVEVVLPDLGDDTDTEIEISAWLAKVGDRLHEGDDLLELTTDKAAFCLPCPQDGILLEATVSVGDAIEVGDVVCILDV